MRKDQVSVKTEPQNLAENDANNGRYARKKKRSALSTVLLTILILAGIGVMAYPTFSDWWNRQHASREIASYSMSVAAADTAELEAMIEAAREYNRGLTEKDNQYYMSDDELELYNSLLDPGGNGLMAYVSIPALKQEIPVYHGTEESVLQTAVGHLTWTSLPVGGESTHSVLSGHRGLPRAKLFTDLDRLNIGDYFTVTVLDQTLAYQVDQILVVLPNETDELTIVQGEDYCTLLTCTPYGINTHRLLVRGRRTELPETAPESEPETVFTLPEGPAAWQDDPLWIRIPMIAIPVMFVLLLVLIIIAGNDLRKAKAYARRKKHEK